MRFDDDRQELGVVFANIQEIPNISDELQSVVDRCFAGCRRLGVSVEDGCDFDKSFDTNRLFM